MRCRPDRIKLGGSEATTPMLGMACTFVAEPGRGWTLP
ncbi:MAG: hypothetical protein RLZZ623_860 [Actinomycetota bacterium]|jgi:hypothetical protein